MHNPGTFAREKARERRRREMPAASAARTICLKRDERIVWRRVRAWALVQIEPPASGHGRSRKLPSSQAHSRRQHVVSVPHAGRPRDGTNDWERLPWHPQPVERPNVSLDIASTGEVRWVLP